MTHKHETQLASSRNQHTHYIPLSSSEYHTVAYLSLLSEDTSRKSVTFRSSESLEGAHGQEQWPRGFSPALNRTFIEPQRLHGSASTWMQLARVQA